ncbi:DMT family transporter [Pontivivens insulae]|uniref:Riboflavin transporter n=1 Tax=Pontivivens insulae TaxID=1639689 RepID=A0A2R8AEX0_9RHOB|nr:DMT family transporter [Pontivivens insulae]RED12006.1 EamA-like transporter family protein [Pontivivens insulae]SPF30762.1 Riboflavin transporter [Pontivivens insulae]
MNLRVVAMMLIAAACMGAASLIAKALGSGPDALHPFQVSAGRFVFALAALSIGAVALRPRIVQPNLPLHVTRVFLGWGGVTCLFAAVALMPVADATAITFINPIIAMLLAIPLLGERVGKWRFAAAGIAFSGALLLIRPGTDAMQPAALIALAGAVLMGAEVIAIKRLTAREAPFQILIVNNIIGCVIALTVASFVWNAPSSLQWLGLAGLGLCVVSAQVCFLQAMKGEASFAMPFFYTTLIFAALLDFALFGVIPSGLSLIGAATIVGAALLLVWREHVAAKVSRV